MSCLQCASELPSHTGRGRPRKYCIECRPPAVKRESSQSASGAREVSCTQCLTTYVSHHPRARFCSQRCKDLASRVPCAGCSSPIFLGSGSREVGKARCRDCIKMEREHGTITMYKAGGCRCPECRKAHAESCAPYQGSHRRRARRFGGAYEPLNRESIFERDGWMCGICSTPVDPRARFPDPGTPSLDHIVPLSRGGAHCPSNVQLAHYYCNNVKGNREVQAC